MSQANVYTTVSAQAWYTDRCLVSTGNTAVTYNVDIVYPNATGNLFSAAVSIPPYASQSVFVGVGNKLTIAGSNFTAQEQGTTTSGSHSVRDTNGVLPGGNSNYGI